MLRIHSFVAIPLTILVFSQNASASSSPPQIGETITLAFQERVDLGNSPEGEPRSCRLAAGTELIVKRVDSDAVEMNMTEAQAKGGTSCPRTLTLKVPELALEPHRFPSSLGEASAGQFKGIDNSAASACKNLRYWGCFCKDPANTNPPPHEHTQLPGMDITYCEDGKNDLEFSRALDTYSAKCAAEAAKLNPALSNCRASGRSRTAAECAANPFPGCNEDRPQNPPKIRVYPPPNQQQRQAQ